MILTLDNLPTAAELTDPRLAIQFAIGLEAIGGMPTLFLQDWLDGKDLETYWLVNLREDLALDLAA